MISTIFLPNVAVLPVEVTVSFDFL